jgi:hypothetical protein
MSQQEAYERAKKRVESRIGFYIHLAVYVGMNLLLVIINLASSPQYLWFKWPLFGWGIGVFFHGLSVFVFLDRRLEAVKERMIEKEISRNKRRG